MFKNKCYFRVFLCFCLIIALLFACAIRIFTINNQNYAEVHTQSNSYLLNLSRLRGTIFDCNMKPLTNNNSKTVSAFLPTEAAIMAASSLEKEKSDSILASLKNGTPTLAKTLSPIDCFGVYSTTVYENTSSSLLAPQLIGYLDSEGHGVTGLQKEYDDILYSPLYQSIAFATDGLGNIITGAQINEINDKSVINSGIALTLDSDIQLITLNALEGITCGAAVVSEIGTGKIRAMVSVPEFDATKVKEYLNAPNSPLINRAVSAYNVGSVFKPCVSAAGIESGFQNNYTVNCVGYTQIAGNNFKCHNLAGHGIVDIAKATAFSCNSFFYNYAINIGAEALYKMASKLHFTNGYQICNGITANADITKINTLKNNQRALANLAIGQGELLLSPVSILSLYEAIANEGVYYPQTIIEGTVTNGAIKHETATTPTRAMSKKTAKILKEHLKSVIDYGTGTTAKPQLTTAAGKTATAQTGWQKNDRLIQNSWFCGFFPYDNPKYVISVLVEDSLGSDDIGAPVFSKICDGITTLKR